jgi:rplV_bact: ribosomal protein L22
VILR